MLLFVHTEWKSPLLQSTRKIYPFIPLLHSISLSPFLPPPAPHPVPRLLFNKHLTHTNSQHYPALKMTRNAIPRAIKLNNRWIRALMTQRSIGAGCNTIRFAMCSSRAPPARLDSSDAKFCYQPLPRCLPIL